jgi:hypothetical protein
VDTLNQWLWIEDVEDSVCQSHYARETLHFRPIGKLDTLQALERWGYTTLCLSIDQSNLGGYRPDFMPVKQDVTRALNFRLFLAELLVSD